MCAPAKLKVVRNSSFRHFLQGEVLYVLWCYAVQDKGHFRLTEVYSSERNRSSCNKEHRAGVRQRTGSGGMVDG
jgi:hypothetical protein